MDFSSNRRGSLAEFVTPKRAGLSWAVSEMSSVELDDPYKRTGFILDSVIPAKGKNLLLIELEFEFTFPLSL